MSTHCSHYDSLIFNGKILETEAWVSVCLEPGLQYGFHYGTPGEPLIVSFSIDSMTVRGGSDWQRLGNLDWTSLMLPFDGMTFAIWVSRPSADGERPHGKMSVAGRGNDTVLEFDRNSIFSTLPFD